MNNNIQESPIRSVSGIRAIIGETATPYTFAKYAYIMGKLYGKGGNVVIGRDTRISGDEVKKAIIQGLLKSNCKPIDIGICPTPTTGFMTKQLSCDFGIMISASHNPMEWNAIKLMHKDGRHFNEQECNSVYDAYDKCNFNDIDFNVAIVEIKTHKTSIQEHINEVLKYININDIKKKKFKVAVDLINGAGYEIIPKLLDILGVEKYLLNDKPSGIFAHNAEPRPEHLTELASLVHKEKCDIGFAVDPDADRLALILPNGNAISEEYTLTLVCDYLTEKHSYKPVVTNLSTSMLIDFICKKNNIPIIRSKVGEANVVSSMKENNATIGGEGNGGIIFSPIVHVRDSVVGIAFILNMLADKNKTIIDIVNTYPNYHLKKEKIDCPREKMKYVLDELLNDYKKNGLEVDIQDGIRISTDEYWLGIRQSNTENILRIFSEAENENKVDKLIKDTLIRIKSLI